jgi:hypothetical protein
VCLLQKTALGIILDNTGVTLLLLLIREGACCFIVANRYPLPVCFDVCLFWDVFGAFWTKNYVVALMPKLIDVMRHEGRVWCADLLMDVGMRLACEVCVMQVGALCPERSRFTHFSCVNVSAFADEVIMLCMESSSVRMMQLTSFTLSFT